MIDVEKNINLNEQEIRDLLRAINVLIEHEEDTRDYTDLINKLYTYYD